MNDSTVIGTAAPDVVVLLEVELVVVDVVEVEVVVVELGELPLRYAIRLER